MKSNYKRLGDYIERCDEFNVGMKVKELLGISNQKYFQKAKTNTIGINLEKYRIVRTNQFAFNRATTRNGDKISIALRQGDDCIVSPSYRIFESKDEEVLNSEYLMMWFRRPEFDRYARFKSHGSAHEFFDIDEMFEVEIPIPSIEKQCEIVKEYNIIANRISLNEELSQKLEETAQTLYKHWFVDFEFPNEDGKPYKTSGGEMYVDRDLNQAIPKGWSIGTFQDHTIIEMGQSPKGDTYNKTGEGTVLINGPVEFGDYFTEKRKWTTSPTKISKIGDLIVCVRGSTVGRFVKSDGEYCLGRGVCSFRGKISQRFVDQLYKYHYQELLLLTTGSTFPNWDRLTLSNFAVIVPLIDTIKEFQVKTEKLYFFGESLSHENQSLLKIRSLVLSKMSNIQSLNVKRSV